MPAKEGNAQVSARVYNVSAHIPVALSREYAALAREELVEAIHASVGTLEAWFDGVSTVSFAGDRMVVKTTPSNHARIAKLLASLGPVGLIIYGDDPEPSGDGTFPD